MAILCPQCAAPAALAAEAVDAAGRMARCGRCGTAWLARVHVDDQLVGAVADALSQARKSRQPRFERVIEHVGASFAQPSAAREANTVPPVRPVRRDPPEARVNPAKAARPVRRPRPSRPAMQLPSWGWIATGKRALGAWSGISAALVLAVFVAYLTFDMGRAGDDGSGQFAGLEIRMLQGALEPVRTGQALAVEGEITNRSGDEMGVPAVRVSLRSDGAEVYSWLVEPTTMRLAAGHVVSFRSVLAAPPAGVDEVALRLAERKETVVGMR